MAIETSARFKTLVSYALLKAMWQYIHIYEGTKPLMTNNPGAGTCLASILVPSDWTPEVVPFAGGKSIAAIGLVEELASTVIKTGTATYYRIQDRLYSGETTQPYLAAAHLEQGNVTASGGGGDMEISSTSLVLGNPIGLADIRREVPVT